jgi:hypothetical protein
VFLGAIGGPASYLSGVNLGAIAHFPHDYKLLLLAGEWALAMPVLLWPAKSSQQRSGKVHGLKTREKADVRGSPGA